MGDWLPYAILCAVLLACGFWSGYCIRAASAARELARLRGLVPSPGLLRSLAYCADGIVPVSAEAARALAVRIEAEGAGAESVAAGEGE